MLTLLSVVLLLVSLARPGAAAVTIDKDQDQISPSFGNNNNNNNNKSGLADTGPYQQQKHESPRPFYAIAHRVLTAQGVLDALGMGANALEIDMTAWPGSGWWADHDGTPSSAGDRAADILQTVAEQRRLGQPVIFVWLDIKNPDRCAAHDDNTNNNNNDKDHHHHDCSVAALRDLARSILEPVGIRVLYGFYSADGAAYRQLQGQLNALEAVNLNGPTADVVRAFTASGPLDVARRTMAYGLFWLPFQFGDCLEPRYYTCTELRQAVLSPDIGLVLGWTLAAGQASYLDSLLRVGIDGLIFGFKATHFYDHADTRAAFADITAWLDRHSDVRRLATLADLPW